MWYLRKPTFAFSLISLKCICQAFCAFGPTESPVVTVDLWDVRTNNQWLRRIPSDKMAVAMGMLENVNDGKEASPVVKRIKERFNLCFHYLKYESSVQDYFLKRLPNHIQPYKGSNGKLWKGYFHSSSSFSPLFLSVCFYSCKWSFSTVSFFICW